MIQLKGTLGSEAELVLDTNSCTLDAIGNKGNCEN